MSEPMEIAISGASGLIGAALADSLRADGNRVAALVRRSPAAGADEIAWDPAGGTVDAASLEGIDAIVHLAGAGIGDRRWTDERKKLIYDSRVDGTELLANAAAGLNRAPAVFVCGSAIGFYGSCGDEPITEATERGTGFLADLVADWEAAAAPSAEAGIRTPLARTGLVMSPKGGALQKQLPLFKLGLGGRLGPGTQWLPWISLRDEVKALTYLINSDLDGPVNLTAPAPVTNDQFTKTLGSVLSRPTLLPVPLFGPKLLFGAEMVAEALLASQRVLPEALTNSGFIFDDPTLEQGLRAMLGRQP